MSHEANLPPDLRALVQTLAWFGRDVTMGQLNALLPQRQLSSGELEDVINALDEHGVQLVADDA